jgi:carbon storage regulator
MLVLTRKSGEAIQIGDDVTVEVLEMRGGRVRLGITAPGDVRVHRRELILDVAPTVEPMPSKPTPQRPQSRHQIMIPVES